jgi:transposase
LDVNYGINRRAAEGILAEIRLEMSRFPFPGNHKSAGKKLSGKTWHQQLLAAHIAGGSRSAAAHTKNTYLSTQYHHLAARRGRKKAMISILVIVNHMLQQQKAYEEVGGNYFNERQRQTTERQLVRRLEQLVDDVSLKSTHPAV